MAVSTGIAAIVFSVFGASASAQVWNNTTGDGNWLNGDNWVGGVAPTGIADDATVGAPSPATLNGSVNLNSLTVTADGIVNVNGGLNLDFGGTATTTLNNAGTINTGNNSDFQFQNSVFNSGNININAGANSTDIEIDSVGATLDGGGTITLSGGLAGINGVGGSTLTIVDQTIQGQGSIGENAIGIVNQAGGLINANVDGEILTIDVTAAAGAVNAGTLQASDSGVLRVLGSVVDNSGGLIEAGADSTVSFNNSTITGGTLNSVGTGELVVESTTNVGFVDVTNNGNIVSLNNSDTEVSGTITNNGTIELQAGANSTDLEVQSVGATLTGGGTVRLSGGLAGINGVSGGVLDIQSQIVIGEGNLGENAIDIINGVGGTIEADVDGASLTINTSSSLFSNAGTLRASNGATLNVLEDVFNSGIIETAVDSTFEALSLENGVDSLVTGNGIIDVGSGPIDIAGVLAPGGTVGTLTALDDVVLASTAEFQTELLSDSLFDVFSVEGDLELGGILSVELISDFDPLSTDSFLIASTTGDVTGAFSNVANGGLLLTEGGEGTFTVNFGGSSVILSNFTLAAVPEPSAALCLVGLGFGLLARRRRQV